MGASLSLVASYDAVYSADMGAADARDADNPLYSPNGPRCLSMVATTAPTDRLARRSAWIATFTVSTGCSTKLTSVPATAPATAFTLTAARPLTPGVPEPRPPRPSLGRVVARVATRGRSGFDGDVPSCRRIWSARSRNPLFFCRRANRGRAGSRDDLAGTARSMTWSVPPADAVLLRRRSKV